MITLLMRFLASFSYSPITKRRCQVLKMDFSLFVALSDRSAEEVGLLIKSLIIMIWFHTPPSDHREIYRKTFLRFTA